MAKVLWREPGGGGRVRPTLQRQPNDGHRPPEPVLPPPMRAVRQGWTFRERLTSAERVRRSLPDR